ETEDPTHLCCSGLVHDDFGGSAGDGWAGHQLRMPRCGGAARLNERETDVTSAPSSPPLRRSLVSTSGWISLFGTPMLCRRPSPVGARPIAHGRTRGGTREERG